MFLHMVKWVICIPDIELVSVCCRPFYLPCEFSTIFAVLCMYLPAQITPELHQDFSVSGVKGEHDSARSRSISVTSQP